MNRYLMRRDEEQWVPYSEESEEIEVKISIDIDRIFIVGCSFHRTLIIKPFHTTLIKYFVYF